MGDDWTIAAAIMAALVVTSVLVRAHVESWWLLPIIVIVSLTASLWRAVRSR